MSFRRYWVVECDFGGTNCEGQGLGDSKLTQSEVHHWLEMIGWRWADKRLACPPCAAEEQHRMGIEVQA